nr:alpha/beta fold hydrolase [Clostridia bacterium]
MLYKKIEQAFRAQVYSRSDDIGAVFYFSSDDFEGMVREEYPFTSSDGHKLSGYFYHYGKPKSGRFVVFDHGMGSGQRGYMKEIEHLARRGYLVFAYDHTGCMESGGTTTGGFPQSLKDLNDAITTLKADPKYSGCTYSVIGHSWGAFSTLNICALHPDITHICAMSGFISVEAILKQFFGGIMWIFGKRIYAAVRAENPDFAGYNAVETLKNAGCKALIIHSDDDPTVSCAKHFDVMQKALADKANIKFHKVTGKAHNPNYTEAAVKYKDEFFADFKQALSDGSLVFDEDKKKFKASYDWNRMTMQDDNIWKMIFEHLES